MTQNKVTVYILVARILILLSSCKQEKFQVLTVNATNHDCTLEFTSGDD